MYDVASAREAHLSDFISEDGTWRWPCVTWELTEILRLAKGVHATVGCEDR